MTVLIVMALSWLSVSARDLTVSLITCYPGEEIYELCGHTAIRVRGEGIDSVWNYGIFNFNEPNFVYRFVKGETDYMVAGYPFSWFLPEYVNANRRVVEQDLNLTPEEAQNLLKNLRIASLPENRRYRYNYIKDNCSTRIINQIGNASSEEIIYPDTVIYGTFRDEMREYHRNYPWYQFGIDLALGSGLDYPLNSEEEMFVPVELMKKAGEAHFADGRPLVEKTRVLNEGSDNAILPPTPWFQGPLFLSWIIALIIIGLSFYEIKRGKIIVPLYFIWFFVLGLAGCLITFLVFVSVHAATSPNALIFWLNPLQLFMCAGVCSRRLKPLASVMAWYNLVAVTLLLVVWPFINQSANPSFFPLMGATSLMGAIYAILANKSSYNINGQTRKKNVREKKK